MVRSNLAEKLSLVTFIPGEPVPQLKLIFGASNVNTGAPDKLRLLKKVLFQLTKVVGGAGVGGGAAWTTGTLLIGPAKAKSSPKTQPLTPPVQLSCHHVAAWLRPLMLQLCPATRLPTTT